MTIEILNQRVEALEKQLALFLNNEQETDKSKKPKKSNINNKFGQDVKSRAGSTRNGFANTFANNNSNSTTEKQVKERNEELGINPDICMYCNINPKEDNDHLIPQCCTKNSIYGQNNTLNRVPACSQCNGKKGGKVNHEFKLWLNKYCKWSQNKIDILFNWINKNKDNLFINEEGCKYLEEQYKHIDMFHEIFQNSCKNKEDIMINFIKHIAQYTSLRDKATQIFTETPVLLE